MIERVVENWLTSTNERGYEIPFCQLLAFQGHRILHISSHGPQEQGKDIITIAPDGVPCAYQLKGEKHINLRTWRAIRGEIEELIEIPIQHPSVTDDFPYHRAYLVNNGLLADTVRREIQDRNRAYRRRGLPVLNLILKGDLLRDFIGIHGRFLPSEPNDFRRFLELYLSDGGALPSEKRLSDFLVSILPVESKAAKKSELKRALASSLVLTSYVLSPYTERRNHVALIIGWVLLASHVLAIADKWRLPNNNWKPTFDLCVFGIEEELTNLVSESMERENLLEGDPFTDGLVYKTRITLLLGYFTAYDNYLYLTGSSSEHTSWIKAFVEAEMDKMILWGESAVPAFLNTAWFLERNNKQLIAEHLILSVVNAIVTQNSPRNRGTGLPDPYHSAESVMFTRFGLDEDELDREDYVGHSYCLKGLVEWLARRLRRQGLARLWSGITRISCSEFFGEPIWATYLWESKKGELRDRFLGKPQSWKLLLSQSQSQEYNSVPAQLLRSPEFLLMFLLVYPHRLRSELLRFLDLTMQQGD